MSQNQQAPARQALVVGGDIHFRLYVRRTLIDQGYRVHLVRSFSRGLSDLRDRRFDLCVLPEADTPADGDRIRRFRRAATAAQSHVLVLARPVTTDPPATGRAGPRPGA